MAERHTIVRCVLDVFAPAAAIRYCERIASARGEDAAEYAAAAVLIKAQSGSETVVKDDQGRQVPYLCITDGRPGIWKLPGF
jgi:hypothetical protein